MKELEISVCVTTKNNIDTIEDCLKSVHGWVGEIIVVDSHSTDGTIQVCQKYGAKVYQKEFGGFADIKNHAIELASNEWVLILDSDERIPADLKKEIHELFPSPNKKAYRIKKRNKMFGEWMHIKHPARPLLAKKEEITYKNNYIWEELSVISENIDTGSLDGCIEHYAYERISEKVKKVNQYSSLQAIQDHKRNRRNTVLFYSIYGILAGFYCLFIRGAALDGMNGLIFSVSESYQYFLVYFKRRDLNRLIRESPNSWEAIWLEEECGR
ncbi:glycosyltransferase family 2 protein [Halobaculum sp. EA56]|uniref:glycosyltransferase family 2 protein n=1 Tax=Halobaculum sp. EA56 TaxID=3421648 RepID=UPI003EB78705